MSAPLPIQRIIKRDGSTVAYDRGRIARAILKATTAAGREDAKLADAMAEKVELALVDTYQPATMPSVEDIQDVVESVLMENRHTEIARKYIIYRHQRAMARAARAYAFEVTDNIPYRKIYESLRWNMEQGCDSVAGLNRIIRRGKLPDLIHDADQEYDTDIEHAANAILNDLKNIRLVIVAGPSSSGKTSTTIKIGERLKKAGVAFKALNVDHYFFDREFHPRDEFGDYDYERPEALDMKLINEHIEHLLAGRTVKTPHYSFKHGERRLDAHDMALAPNEILLIDSLHGLSDEMTRRVSPHHKFKLYVETLGQFRDEEGNFMRWADNRLLRRMCRDKDHRNQQPLETLTHWHYVRRSELQYIIPYIKTTNYIVNTALPYELPFLKHRLFRFISAGMRRYGDDPRRRDAHIRAQRVYALLKPVKPVADDTCIPGNSLLREFIGGSRYVY